MNQHKLNDSEVRAEQAASKPPQTIQLALADAVHSCHEAGPFGYGLHRELVALGVQNVVVQPVCLDERHTGVNHDKSDAQELALRRALWQRDCKRVKRGVARAGQPQGQQCGEEESHLGEGAADGRGPVARAHRAGEARGAGLDDV